MKKLLPAILSALLLISSLPASAESGISVNINENAIDFSAYDNVMPYIENDRTLIPLRAIAENLGFTVDWDGETKTITAISNNTNIELIIDSYKAEVNGEIKTLDVPARITGDRTFVPLRFIAENFGVAVVWDDETRIISIDTQETSPQGEFKGYIHDPRENPSAMADIVADSAAVYGFRPSTEGSLKQYADADWTDAETVEKGREERIAYHNSIEEMYKLFADMKAEGKTIEEIARAVSAKRNEIRLAAYSDNPEGLEDVKARNLEKYGHEEGPMADDLYKQYGSWQKVLEKAFSTNSGMDACLGLYDDYYELYIAAGQVSADTLYSDN